MRTKYIDLIDQTFDFHQNEFNLREDRLFFHGIDLMRLINEYGTPLKLNYLPQISNNIQRAKGWFREAINNLGYSGNYYYSYCTKSSHFSFVLDEVLKNDVHIETSSAFDIDIVMNLYNSGKLEKRSMRKARDLIVRKLTKDIPKKDLSFARKQEIEKRLDKPAMQARIKRIARKMFPKIRKAEVERKKG